MLTDEEISDDENIIDCESGNDFSLPYVDEVAESMENNPFDDYLVVLDTDDNTLISPNSTDKLFKLNPLIDYCTEKFSKSYYGTRELSIDESMIVFKGRSKDEQVSDEFKHFGLGERIVLELSKKKLKLEGCLAYGAIRPNRKGLPKLADDTKSKRGTYDYRISDLGISVFKWKDTKTVHFASNYHGSEVTTVLRKNKTAEKNNVTCPQVVKDYNRFMGGVDHADQLRMSYGVDRKSKKWWHRLFWGILDIMFINAFVIYKERHKKIPLLVFRRQVVHGLLSEKEVITPSRAHLFQKRKNTENTEVPKKRRGKPLSVSKDVRLHNRGIHWLKFT
ncbi:piggyBac transposable element-derived protein 3-like [Metopolophium dirhodum]|uniref:piggyBac transposable element-derived protein 3-like n=1 Tax=Metopolophium dirhodum TaxID=44670 RepID=UPI00298F5156|nr:piggyBac transposable element-derived protein 3-like [Metopolophium dirhodum]